MKPSYRWLYAVAIYVSLMITAGTILTPDQNTPAIIYSRLGVPLWVTGGLTFAGAFALLVLWRNQKRDNAYLVGITPLLWYGGLSLVTIVFFGGGLAGFGITSGFLAMIVITYFWLNGHH